MDALVLDVPEDGIMINLYRFHEDCGRMGTLDGLFLADPVIVAMATAPEAGDVYFDEPLGKHSEYYNLPLELGYNIELITQDQDFTRKMAEYVGEDTISGLNPISMWLDQHAETEITR